jgi:hypothetical protein
LPSSPLYPYDGEEGSDRAIKVNMESYIVRIYRGETDNTHNIVGTVEQAGTEERKSFADIDELWDIFNPLKKRQKKGKSAGLVGPKKQSRSLHD